MTDAKLRSSLPSSFPSSLPSSLPPLPIITATTPVTSYAHFLTVPTQNYGQGHYPVQQHISRPVFWAYLSERYTIWTMSKGLESWELAIFNLCFFLAIFLSLYSIYAYWDVHVENWATILRFIRDLLFMITHPHVFVSEGTATATTPSGGIGHHG